MVRRNNRKGVAEAVRNLFAGGEQLALAVWRIAPPCRHDRKFAIRPSAGQTAFSNALLETRPRLR